MPDGPLQSLVLFLDAPREANGTLWISHLGEALGIDLLSEEKDPVNFVLPMPHPSFSPAEGNCFMLKIPQGVFWIFLIRRPYFDDIAGWAKTVPDGRIREAIAGHQAWISVDLVSWLNGPPDQAKIYDILGKAVAALAGPDTRAIYSPELNRANEFDPILLPQLRGGDPLSIFENSTFASVMNIRSSDEQMEAAIEEARRRWPEFVSLFNRRDPTSERPFIVKAPFSEGDHAEFMWMVVTSLGEDVIHGTLANHPHRLLDYHEGQNVSISTAEIADWLCMDERDQPLGGWTNEVLKRQQPRV